MKSHLKVALIVVVALNGIFGNYAFAIDSPPKIDYASIKTSASVIAGENVEITFRATDDVGLNSIGPVASIRSLQYPTLFFYFSNCYLASGDRKDGIWNCKIPTEKTNPLGTYRLILVLTDTVGQHTTEEPLTGWTNVANFEMRELTAQEKAAADKAAADKAAADKVAADKAAADKVAADKAAAVKVAADKATAKPVAKEKIIVCLKGKSSLKVIGKNPKCPPGYKVKK